MSALLASLEQLLALSEKMAAAAGEEEWENLVRLGEERGALVAALPGNIDSHLAAGEKARARAIIERHQQFDANTRELVEERQKALRVLLRETVA
jgi:hypothetical protein